ncbi:MAG: C-GCAxxG-C-C family protein [Actinomycetota bacterium]
MKVTEEVLTRRKFLANAGSIAAGLAIGGSLLVAGCSQATQTKEEMPKEEMSSKMGGMTHKLPWPYEKLDPDEVAELAYQNWYKGFCGYAVASAIIAPLQKKIGEPYTSIPLDALTYFHGGVVGWGTMCGTMIGAGFAASLIGGPGVGKTGEQIANEVIHYYAETELPNYTPKNPKLTTTPVKSKSDSPLCHISVGRWMKKADRGFWSPERKDRCARLSADVAVQTVKLLNELADGKFKASHELQPAIFNITAQSNCTDCHTAGVPAVNTKGNQ